MVRVKRIRRTTSLCVLVFGLVASLLSSCSEIEKSNEKSAIDELEYVFEGLDALTENTDGSFSLLWRPAPANRVFYAVYSVENQDSAAGSEKLLKWTTETNLRTEKYAFGLAPCFLVRFSLDKERMDSNQRRVCPSGRQEISFSGIKTASPLTSTTVRVTWDRPDKPGIAGFRIYEGTNFTKVASTAGAEDSSRTITNLSPGTTYSFAVRMFNADGLEDANTVTLQVTTP